MIKCFIIAAMTADGFIAKDPHHPALWTSKDDKKRFVEITKRAGVVVMGLNTYRTLHRPLKERVNIVYSAEGPIEGAEVTTKTPVELLKDLEARGFKEVAICGGSTIYTMFMKAKVVDKLYLTLEPIFFGSGMKLFNDDLLFHLKLQGAVQGDTGSLLVEYDVDFTGTPKVN